MMDLVIDPLVAMLTDLFTASAFGLTELVEPGPDHYNDYCAGCDETREQRLMSWTADGRYLCWFCQQMVCAHDRDPQNYCLQCRQDYLTAGTPRMSPMMRVDWKRHRDPLA